MSRFRVNVILIKLLLFFLTKYDLSLISSRKVVLRLTKVRYWQNQIQLSWAQ